MALGSFLKECPHLVTLGVRSQFSSYTSREMSLIKASPILFFPTYRYVAIFQAASKPTFPSPYSYHFRKWRVSQWTLASYFHLPRIKTLCYSRNVSPETILGELSLPLRILGLINNRSSGTLVKTRGELEDFLKSNRRMIIVQEEPLNIVAKVSLIFTFYRWSGFVNVLGNEAIPTSIINCSSEIVRKAQLDDIAIDWILTEKGWLFAGMDFPPRFFTSPPHVLVSRKEFLCQIIKEIATGLDWEH